MWMLIRSKELQLNKHGRAELYCHFVLLLVKPRMIAKYFIRRNEHANRLSVCGTNNVFFRMICAKSRCKYLRDRGFVSVDCVCIE